MIGYELYRLQGALHKTREVQWCDESSCLSKMFWKMLIFPNTDTSAKFRQNYLADDANQILELIF